MRRTQLSLALAATALTLAPGAFAADGLTASEVKIGMVNVQTGPASGLGKGMRSGAEAVFKGVNAKGGVHGRKINLVVGDDGYEPDKAVDETLKMIEQQKVFSLFGYVGTPTGNAVLPIVKEMDVPLVGLSESQRKDRNGRFYKWRDAMLVATNDVAVPLQPDTWRAINEKWLEFNKTFK